MEPIDRQFENIVIGNSASFDHTFTEDDIKTFAKLTGDINPLHTDVAYAALTRFKKPIMHGMLVGALCSTLVGMHLPGKRCLYLRQGLSFRQPVYPGDALCVTGTVTEKIESTRMLTISISITREGIPVIDGEASVQVL